MIREPAMAKFLAAAANTSCHFPPPHRSAESMFARSATWFCLIALSFSIAAAKTVETKPADKAVDGKPSVAKKVRYAQVVLNTALAEGRVMKARSAN